MLVQPIDTKKDTYQVYNRQTKQPVGGTSKGLRRANTKADKLDLVYGAINHFVKRIG